MQSKISDLVLYGLLLISVAVGLLFTFDVIGEGSFLGWSYILLGIGIIVSIVFPIITLVGDFGKAKSALFGIVGLLVIFGISYGLASGEEAKVGDMIITESTSRLSEAGLNAFYFLAVAAVGTILFVEVNKAFK